MTDYELFYVLQCQQHGVYKATNEYLMKRGHCDVSGIFMLVPCMKFEKFSVFYLTNCFYILYWYGKRKHEVGRDYIMNIGWTSEKEHGQSNGAKFEIIQVMQLSVAMYV